MSRQKTQADGHLTASIPKNRLAKWTPLRLLIASFYLILLLAGAQILFDVPVFSAFMPKSQSMPDKELVAVYANGVQTISGKVGKGSFPSLIVQKGIPVRLTLTVADGDLNDCNRAILIPAYGIRAELTHGSNVISFTPKEPGVFPYTCWMHMIKANITVVESLGFASEENTKTQAAPTAFAAKTAAAGSVTANAKAAPVPATKTKQEVKTAGKTAANAAEQEPQLQKDAKDASVGGWLEGQLTPGEKDKGAKQLQTWTGWIFDRDCIGISPVKHTRVCNLMGACIESGLGIIPYVPGKAFDSYTALDSYLNFDGASKELAVAFLKALPSGWKNNVTVKVTGYAVNNIPVSGSETPVPETDTAKVSHYLSGIHITSIEAAYIEGLSTNAMPKPNIVCTQP